MCILTARKCKEDKIKFYDKLLAKCQGNQKEYWKIIKNEIGNGKSDSSIKSLIINNKKIEVSENEVFAANSFNDYFCNVANTLLNEHNASPVSELQPSLNNFENFSNLHSDSDMLTNNDYLENVEITNADVKEAITQLPNKYSFGPDGIKISWIKNNIDSFTNILTPLFNKSLENGIFPNKLKLSIIVPIYKNGNKDNIQNYRPISLISNVSKIFEFCI